MSRKEHNSTNDNEGSSSSSAKKKTHKTHELNITSIQSSSEKQKTPHDRHKKIQFPSSNSSHKGKSCENDKNKTFIKIDYIKTNNSGGDSKTREDVSRVLDFSKSQSNNTNNIKKEEETVKTIDKSSIKIEEVSRHEQKSMTKNSSGGDKGSSSAAAVAEMPIKKEIKVEKDSGEVSVSKSSNEKQSSSSSQSHHHHRHHHHHHKNHSSSSSHSKSKKSSSRECSRCYRRSKIKKINTGIQANLDYKTPVKLETRKLQFEPSHRVSINRNPVTIDTNLEYLKYKRFYHIEVHPNGGASIVHMYQDELDTLSEEDFEELVNEFFELVFSEDENNFAYHVMGVVHDGARYIPDLLEHMAENYSNLTVKAGVIGKNNDIETCTMLHYYEQVMKNYSEGTVRYGPLHQISLVGKVHEEVGGYFPDLLGKLEQNKFLKKSMPWGKLSIVQMDPRLSNDGPILWVRPGEQLIPTAEMKTPMKRQRTRINELRNLQYLPRASESREIMFEDRTRAHAGWIYFSFKLSIFLSYFFFFRPCWNGT